MKTKREIIWIFDSDDDMWHIAQRIDDSNNDDRGYTYSVDTWCDKDLAVNVNEIEICIKPNKNDCKMLMATNKTCKVCIQEKGVVI